MEVQISKIHDAFYLELDTHKDHRGCFQELYNESRYEFLNWNGIKQINKSFSKRNVIRGIHQAPFGKLVSCIKGRVYDVVVDLRKDSPTYKEWEGFWLTPEQKNQVYVPPNCGHAFFTARDSIVLYGQDDLYDPKLENSVHWTDKQLDIMWPEPKNSLFWQIFSDESEYIVSDKDAEAPFLE